METRDRQYGLENFKTKQIDNKNINIYVGVGQNRSSDEDLDLALRRSVDEELALSDDSDLEESQSSPTRINKNQIADVSSSKIKNDQIKKLPNNYNSDDSESDCEYSSPTKKPYVPYVRPTQGIAYDDDDDEDSDVDLRLNRIINEHTMIDNKSVSLSSENLIIKNGTSKRSRSSSVSSSSDSTDSEEHTLDNNGHTSCACCPHKCQVCSKSFRSNADLLRHMRCHTGERPFVCEYCSKSFTQHTHLQRHLLTHPDKVSQHKCPHCDKVYSHKMQLLGHMSVHNKKDPVTKTKTKYKCEYCQKIFDSQRKHKSHTLAHINGNLHCCDVCGRSFKMKSYLIVHQRTHTQNKVYTGDRPFACKVCGKGFLSSSNLELHSTIHEYDKTSFPCEVCGKEFTRKSNYVAHAKSHYR